MKTVGVITEFNPFHKGHEYFLNEVRSRSGADNIIVIMSGNFVQRGEPALWDKFTRTKTALLGGADLILELPLPFATGSAQYFAEGAVTVLNKLCIVDELWFGSESGDISLFETAADILSEESETFSNVLNENLKLGHSYPKARSAAVIADLKVQNNCSPVNESDFIEFLSAPNNILGIEYCLALKKRNSRIKPMTLKREGSGYHDTDINKKLASATAIRTEIARCQKGQKENSDLKTMDIFPSFYFSEFDMESLCSSSVFADDYSLILRYRLLTETWQTLTTYLDISEDLAKRIKSKENEFESFTRFALLLKSKNQTYSHIARSLIHIILGIKKEDLPKAFHSEFIRVLGFKRESPVMNLIKKNSTITLAVKPSVQCPEEYEKECFASNLYYSVVSDRSGAEYVHEYSRKVIII